MKAKFYICEHCGNLVTTIHNAGVPLVCCGEKMKELLPNTVEASGEKHLPVAELSGSTLTVTVGAVEHPMVDVPVVERLQEPVFVCSQWFWHRRIRQNGVNIEIQRNRGRHFS